MSKEAEPPRAEPPAKRERDYERYVICSKCGFVAQYGRSWRQYWPVDPSEEDVGEVVRERMKKFEGTIYGSGEKEMPETAGLCLSAIMEATIEQIEKVPDDNASAQRGRVCLKFNFQMDDGTTIENYSEALSRWLKDLAKHPKWLFQHACSHCFSWPDEKPVKTPAAESGN